MYNPFRKSEKRTSIDDPHHWPNLFAKLFGFETHTGVNVSPESAIEISAVYACTRVIAETIASLPLMIYKQRTDGGKEPIANHPLYSILHASPNDYQTSFEHREMYCSHLCLRGNAYDYIERNGNGNVTKLVPLNPAEMIVYAKNGIKSYEYHRSKLEGSQETVFFVADEVWHKIGLSSNGFIGLSPITLARQALGLAVAQEAYAGRFFKNDAKPSGILKTPAILQEDKQKILRDNWQKALTSENQHKTALLMGDLTWQQVGMSNEDSQFIESRNFQIEEIARIFRVPAILIGHPNKTMTYASAEQFMMSFVVHTIRPWLVRLEQSMNKYLLSESDRNQDYFCQHKIEGLLRGDTLSRYQAYASARQNLWMSANEIRMLENMNPIKGGDEYINPNITQIGDKGAIPK